MHCCLMDHGQFSLLIFVDNKAKGESQNGRFKKRKHVKFSEKQKFLTHDTHLRIKG